MQDFKAKAKQCFKDAINSARAAKADRQYHLLNLAVKDALFWRRQFQWALSN